MGQRYRAPDLRLIHTPPPALPARPAEALGGGATRRARAFRRISRGEARRDLRRKRRRATELGYRFTSIDPLAELKPIRAINASLDARQGDPIDPAYLDPAALSAYFSRSTEFGILRTCGEVASVRRLLGHGDALEQGVMYLLLSETVRELMGARGTGGPVRWLMYDTWFGAAPGLRYFKDRLGFAPGALDVAGGVSGRGMNPASRAARTSGHQSSSWPRSTQRLKRASNCCANTTQRLARRSRSLSTTSFTGATSPTSIL